MRKPDPITLSLPPHLVQQAALYAPSRDPFDAVCYILQDYPNVVGELRQLRRRVADLDAEGAELDALLAELKVICARVLDL
ncbi:hypothetical protein ACOXVJ_27565 [Pseudomonas knackmussii]|uniref:hypothetical protein n=1 Tax=Pseudomonas knackmussii TaxID=65741 RepID=UPI003BC9BFE3